MAVRALLASAVRAYPNSVHPALLRDSVANFRMTLEALQLRSAAPQVMAFRAVRRP